MVYCGKPSRACHACRQRKTRCDARAGGCTQCEKARRVCPGYRAQVDLIFRDQSTNVIRKAKASEAKKAALVSRNTTDKPRPDPWPEAQPVDDVMLMPTAAQNFIFSMRPTLEERATCHFVSHYVVGIHAPSRGVLDNLALIYRTQRVDDTLSTALRAVSYASYAHHMQSTDITDESRFQYTKAIRLTNDALRCPENATKDTTLLSILILGMYEVLTGCNQKSIQTWMEHVRGSCALIKLRGPDQIQSPQGRRLFIQASVGILTSCIQLSIPVPRHIMKLVRDLPNTIPDLDDFGKRSLNAHLAMLDINQFRAAVERGKYPDSKDIIDEALKLDKTIKSIYDDPPSEWLFHVVPADADAASDLVFHGFYHVYSDLIVANLWNAVRAMRVLLHERIRDTLLAGFTARPPKFVTAEHTEQFQRSTDICCQLQADILASVPQHLGYVKRTGAWQAPEVATFPADSEVGAFFANTPPQSPNLKEQIFELCHSLTSDKPGLYFAEGPASGGFNLLWPLFLAGSMEVATDESRAYCIKSLRLIGDGMGINQALVIARILESRSDVEAWSGNNRVEVVDED